MTNDIAEILISEQRIRERVAEMGRELTSRYAGREPLVVAVMHGCVLFLADLLRQMPLPLDLEFVYCKSYVGAEPGPLEFSQRSSFASTVGGRDVLVVDDIFDTGRTMAHVVEQLVALGAAEVTTAVLLEKKLPRPAGLRRPDLAGFEVGNLFVVGYGLDYNGRYRNLPFIGVLAKAAMTGAGK